MTVCQMLSELAVVLFRHVAGISIALALFVMFKSNYGVNSQDAAWIRWLRNVGFFAMAVALAYAIWRDGSQVSLLLLFYSGVYSLAVNAVAIQCRGWDR